MNGNEVVLDTNIILYLLKGNETLADILEGKKTFVSFITELELLGFKDLSIHEESEIKNLLINCSIINLDEQIKSKTIYIRKNYNIKLPDSIIAASALNFNLPLFSADKGFEKIEDLNFLVYEE